MKKFFSGGKQEATGIATGNGTADAASKGLSVKTSVVEELHKAAGGAFTRKQTIPTQSRQWVKYDKSGTTTFIKADKQTLTQQLGIQLRDLRLLDPHLSTSYPSAILCRERALVVNLEYVKCIITVDHVLVLNATEENVVTFIEDLQRRLSPHNPDGGIPKTDSNGVLVPPAQTGATGTLTKLGSALEIQETPFELRALEVALDSVCSHLENLTEELERSAHPALDALTAQVTTHNLEWVRRTKSRMVRLTTRVETIRELLEKFLDDDEDMHDMNLTARQQDMLERHESQIRNIARTSLGGKEEDPQSAKAIYAKSSDSDSEEEEEEVAAVEMILETYFMQTDNTYNKLQTLCEYIDDTQDYVNTDLDNHRNQLIRLELLVSAATFCVTIVGVISGIFGMNLTNTHEDSYAVFCWVAGGSSVGAVAIFAAIYLWCRYKKLLV